MSFKIYTKTGDKGSTSLVTGQRVEKCDLRIEAYGTVDELNSMLGLMICEFREAKGSPFERELEWLQRVQTDLFACGSELSCFEGKVPKSLESVLVEEQDIQTLESEIDQMMEGLPALTNFVLPGGSRANALAHLGRTICRRAERICVHLSQSETVRPTVITYLNRLSDWFFAVSRLASHRQNAKEVLWIPRKR